MVLSDRVQFELSSLLRIVQSRCMSTAWVRIGCLINTTLINTVKSCCCLAQVSGRKSAIVVSVWKGLSGALRQNATMALLHAEIWTFPMLENAAQYLKPIISNGTLRPATVFCCLEKRGERWPHSVWRAHQSPFHFNPSQCCWWCWGKGPDLSNSWQWTWISPENYEME